MRRAALVLAALPALATATGTPDIPETRFGLEHCLSQVEARLPGRFLGVEMLLKNGEPLYEFSVRARSDRRIWEATCSGSTGRITGIERDVPSPDDPAFSASDRVPEVLAEDAALAQVPGRLVGREYEVSPGGSAWYEFTVVTQSGQEFEVMVDATSGRVIGVDSDEGETRIFRIGIEGD
ncbi:MAG: PepSY domain-containing protein [Betaproteobacteria bacterium]|jgi:uncharacterized membrane protein YkoI